MEIERKYLIEKEQLPADLCHLIPFHKIEQGYLCTYTCRSGIRQTG